MRLGPRNKTCITFLPKCALQQGEGGTRILGGDEGLHFAEPEAVGEDLRLPHARVNEVVRAVDWRKPSVVRVRFGVVLSPDVSSELIEPCTIVSALILNTIVR